jgi:hypothetical protein
MLLDSALSLEGHSLASNIYSSNLKPSAWIALIAIPPLLSTGSRAPPAHVEAR